MMEKLGIITSSKVPDLLDYDKELIPMFAERGLEAEPVLWDADKAAFAKYDFLLMRSAWNYFYKPSEFREFLKYLNSNGNRVLNPPAIMLENMHKFYLKEIQESGFDIIPTFFAEQGKRYDLKDILNELETRQFIIKPAISADSYNTFLYKEFNAEAERHLENLLNVSDVLVQVYMPEIVSSGEFSNIFFSNGFSYTVQKKPASGDYRVQKDYGGIYTRAELPGNIMEGIKKAADLFLDQCLYVRVDGVVSSGKFFIMEIELIEPDLYMDVVPEAKKEFVEAFCYRK